MLHVVYGNLAETVQPAIERRVHIRKYNINIRTYSLGCGVGRSKDICKRDRCLGRPNYQTDIGKKKNIYLRTG